MIKKLFLLLFFITTVLVFSQENNVNKKDTFNLSNTTISQLSAFPNPFKIESQIKFNSTITQNIIFEVKNVLGRSVFKIDTVAQRGKNKITFYRKSLKAGMYFYTIQTDSELISKRLVIK